MAVELITGHAGSAHISSADDGYCNGGLIGTGRYVLNIGTKFAAEVQSANVVTIGTGAALFNGRYVRVTATENVAIDNGAQGMNRNDIICFKYFYDSGTSVETVSLDVIKGTATSGTPTDPTVPTDNIINGATTAYMALWRIPIRGLTVNEPENLYGDVLITLNGTLSKVWDVSQIPNLPASKVTSGTFAAARIPSLDASKIASGTLALARIPSIDASRVPNIDASKVTTGTFAAARIPSLGASKIATGTLSADRIPSISASKIASGTLSADRIPNLSAAKITSGTLAANRIPSLDASKITSGTLAAARIPSLDASKIASGTLATARIPDISAAKITSGTLPVSRGGTGKTSGTAWMADTLYSSAGVNTNITLTASAANYTMMEIFFRDQNSHYASTKVYSPNGKTVCLSMATNNINGQNNYKRRDVTISGTAINTQSYGEQDGGATATSTNNIYIYAVVGYK